MAEVLSLTGGMASPDIATPKTTLPSQLKYIQYSHDLEEQYLPSIRALISKDLSEPYSIYVYRYFLCQWAHLCFMVSEREHTHVRIHVSHPSVIRRTSPATFPGLDRPPLSRERRRPSIPSITPSSA